MLRTLILAAILALPAHAADRLTVKSGDRQTAVVELYTSEGCSSCPPADRWLSRLVETPSDELDLLALSFHVDYWDYLGWKDRFGSRAYTSRQRQLGANNSQRTIYTPEFFVNGKETRGSKTILDHIQQANRSSAPLQLELDVSHVDGHLVIRLLSPPTRAVSGPVHHRYLVYENNLSSDVTRGENRGETLRHQQVVRYMSRAITLKEENHYRIPVATEWKRQDVGVAVIVTSPGSRQYLQALHTPVAGLLVAN